MSMLEYKLVSKLEDSKVKEMEQPLETVMAKAMDCALAQKLVNK